MFEKINNDTMLKFKKWAYLLVLIAPGSLLFSWYMAD